ITSTTRFTCAGSRTWRPRIGNRLPAQKLIGWVVLRHEIDYKIPACLGDEIILRTWVGEASRLKFERFTEVRRKIDNQLLAQARTLWVPIDVRTGKPTRVSAELRAQFST